MPKLRPIYLAVAALAAAGIASAQDVRQEDRRADRQADRRVDANDVEVNLAVPRNADGTVNRTALLNDVRAQVTAGATEIHFRGATAQDARLLLNQSLLTDLRAALPNDGVERHVRLRGEFDARLQRNEDGELRARIEDINLGTLSPAQRAELARQLASQAGLDRIRIRGTDANGARVRVEFRDDKGMVKNEGRGDVGGGRGDDKFDRRDDKFDRKDARFDRKDHRRDDKFDRHDRAERPDRAERHDRGGRPERVERAARVERVERPERAERVERPERPERSGSNSGRG
jgi:hypothetical protein